MKEEIKNFTKNPLYPKRMPSGVCPGCNTYTKLTHDHILPTSIISIFKTYGFRAYESLFRGRANKRYLCVTCNTTRGVKSKGIPQVENAIVLFSTYISIRKITLTDKETALLSDAIDNSDFILNML